MKPGGLLQVARIALLCVAASGCVNCYVGAGPYGTVFDAATGQPIAGAVVTMRRPHDASVATTTDAAGTFGLRLEPPRICFPAGNVVDFGPGSFVVTASGYETKQVSWGSSSTGPLTVTLEKQK